MGTEAQLLRGSLWPLEPVHAALGWAVPLSPGRSGSCPSVLTLKDTSPLSLYAAILAIQLPRATSDQYSVQGKYWALRYLLGMDGKL